MPAPLPRRTLVAMDILEARAEERFATFESAVRTWLNKIGLTDWFVSIDHDADPTDENGAEALIEYDRNTRYATITYYSACEDPQPIERVALHEVLHLLMADIIPEDCSADVAREEHRMIERLLHVML